MLLQGFTRGAFILRPTFSSQQAAPWSSMAMFSIFFRFQGSLQAFLFADEPSGGLDITSMIAKIVCTERAAGPCELHDRVGRGGEASPPWRPTRIDLGSDAPGLEVAAWYRPTSSGGDAFAFRSFERFDLRILGHCHDRQRTGLRPSLGIPELGNCLPRSGVLPRGSSPYP